MKVKVQVRSKQGKDELDLQGTTSTYARSCFWAFKILSALRDYCITSSSRVSAGHEPCDLWPIVGSDSDLHPTASLFMSDR